MDGENCDYLLNYIIIGNSAVGKTSLILRLNNKEISDNYSQTIGVEFNKFNIELNNKKYSLRIYDTGGFENYEHFVKPYFKKLACALIVYGIDNKESFDNIENWIEEFKNLAPNTVLMILIGNKSDLNDNRKVTKEEGMKFAKKNGMVFFETSVKKGDNSIEEVFKISVETIAKQIDKKYYNLNDDKCGIIKPKLDYRIFPEDTSEKENKSNKKSCCLNCFK